MARVWNVETQAKEALDLAKQNEIIINEVLDKQQETNDDLSKRVTAQVKEDLHINKIETQLPGVLLELEDLRNRSIRSNLIFKGIPEESKETWHDTSQLLGGFITENLNLPYSFDQMDMQISRAHRANDTDSSRSKNKSEPRPIIAQFISWRVVEEVRQKIIHLNSRNQLRVIVNQMFSKELTERRNNALIKIKIPNIASWPANKVRLSSNIKVSPERSKQQMIDIGRILKQIKKKEERTWNNSKISTSSNYFLLFLMDFAYRI